MRALMMITILALMALSLLLAPGAPHLHAQDASRPAPPPALRVDGPGFALDFFFPNLRQGTAGLLRLTGDVQAAQAVFLRQEVPFYRAEDGWYGWLVADLDSLARDYPLSVLVLGADGQVRTLETRVLVTSGDYVRQNFVVPSERAYLISPEIERYEYARLWAWMSQTSPAPLWGEAGFRPPLDTPLSARFGDFRILNESVQTRHTGSDNGVPVGTPVAAMAAGRVIYADALDIRGYYVLIDHGWGVFTGYAHFSQINVQAGDQVQAGQIIGASGNSGRSSGPHLHWEVAVNGEWVDGPSFLSLWLPVR
jgi:murein DD-endopeptidase MepM/ murein hydrolase activator NlpD